MNDPRNFNIFFEYNNFEIPAYSFGWEELYIKSNFMDRAIYYIEKITEKTNNKKRSLNKNFNKQILTVCFEEFVMTPNIYMNKIESMLGTKIIDSTIKMLKKQNVPRKKFSDGIELDIYKRCGWEKPKKNLSELEELEIRRKFVKKFASEKAIRILDVLCKIYEEKFMKNLL